MASIFMTNIWLDFIVAFKRNHIRLVVFFSLFACVRRKVSKIRYWKWFVESLGQWFCSSLSLIHESKSIYFAFLRPKFISFSLFKKKREWMTKWYTVWNQITPRIRISLSLAKAQPFPAGLHILFSPFSSLLFGRNHLQKPIRNGWRWFPFIACSAANSLGNWSLWNIARDNTIRLGITFANTNKVAKITCTFFVWFNLLFIQSNKWQSERQKIDSHPFWNGTLLDDFFFIYIQLIDG